MVAFKNELTGKYLPAASTRKEKDADAVKQAWAWYREGIPRKESPVDVPADSIRKLFGDTPLAMRDAGIFVRALRDRGFVKSCVFAGNSGDVPMSVVLGLVMFSGKKRRRKILTPTIVVDIFRPEWPDCHAKAANMPAAAIGLRAGKIQVLRVCDLGGGFPHVRHSRNRIDGYKTAKNNEERIMELPFKLMQDALAEAATLNPYGIGPLSPVFWAKLDPQKSTAANYPELLTATQIGNYSAGIFETATKSGNVS
jgi:hypothetical protein